MKPHLPNYGLVQLDTLVVFVFVSVFIVLEGHFFFTFSGHDPNNLRTLEHFTGMKNGRLINGVFRSLPNVHTAGDCARKCLDLPEHSCLSINYDYGKSGLCELLKSIEGHDYIVAQVNVNVVE